MKAIDLSTNALKLIIKEDITFNEAIKEVFINNESDKDLLPIVSSLVGCELRHHLFLHHILEIYTLEEDEYIVLIALANNYFLKKFEKEDVISYVRVEIKDKYNEDLDNLLTYEGQILDLVVGEIEPTSLEYASLRFNVPKYLLKMWFKHYGKAPIYKLLKRNIKPSQSYYSVNTTKISEDELLRKYELFQKTNYDNVVTFNSKTSIKKQRAYQNYEIFNERLALKLILDKVFPSNHDIEEMTLYYGDDKSVLRDLYIRANKKIGLRVAVNNIDEHPEILHLLRVEKCKNVTYFTPSDYSLMDLAITSPQDLIVVYPKSSSFDKIKKYPDYLLHFKQNCLDELIKNQIESLQGFSKFVRKGSNLLYIVDTLNKKETNAVIDEFLEKNPDFELVESKQYFSFEECDTTMFYCLLKKKDND